MATVIESGVGFVNYGKQAAKGTIATAVSTAVGTNRLKHVGGGFKARKVLGSENYSDGNRFSSPSMFVNELAGAVGTVSLQAQPENIGLFYAQILGSDVVTGASDPYTHTITANNAGGVWGSWWQKLGSAVGPVRQAYWDAKITKLTQNSPRDRNVVHLDVDIAALKAGQVFTTDPTKTEDAADPYLLTEATGAFTFDATVVSEITDSVIEIDTGIDPFYGDALEPLQLIEARAEPGITWSVESIITDATLLKYNKALYDATAPAADARPGAVVFAPAVSQVFTRSATRTVTISAPKVVVDPDAFEEMAPQVDGGAKAIRFGGACLKSGATSPLTAVVLSADATTYA